MKTRETLSGGSVQVWGQNLYYEAAGVSEYGPSILFLHESGGSAATWHGQLVGLAQSARCLVVDLPGHGRSEGAGFGTVGEYREALIAFLDALAIRWPVVVAGVCLGAAIAVDMALHAPDRVAGLLLAGVTEQGRACDRVWRQASFGEAPEEFVHGMFSHGAPLRIVSQRLQRWRLTSPLVRYGALTALREYPLRRALHGVRHPVLLVAGEEDSLASPEVTRELAVGIPRGRVATVPRAGCLAMMEQPAAFNRLMAEWLDEVRPAGPEVPELRRPGGYRRTRYG
ncbi:MAG TPA: alpha/beta hydrolase [Symbiobacteriaceae bacterium]|nr:alpha/beta hydrolase [Symbiobacteriaceae bacterium]